jgi:hypothetical protein
MLTQFPGASTILESDINLIYSTGVRDRVISFFGFDSSQPTLWNQVFNNIYFKSHQSNGIIRENINFPFSLVSSFFF